MIKNPIGDFYDFARCIVSDKSGCGIGYLYRKGNGLTEKAKQKKGVMRVVYNAAGFTLVELSIVLVIVGLLIGGILVAQSMIGTARIQSQVRQFQQYDIAATNFKQKFNQIPGDCSICPRAGAAWAADGNGRLNNNTGTTPPTSLFPEAGYFFIDLYAMGITQEEQRIGGAYTYRYGRGNMLPAAAIGRSGLMVSGNAAGGVYYAFTTNKIDEPNISQHLVEGSVSPAEALAIDSKVDNGIPTTGNVAATSATVAAISSLFPFTAETDSSAHCVHNVQYNTALSATNLCRLVVKSNFH